MATNASGHKGICTHLCSPQGLWVEELHRAVPCPWFKLQTPSVLHSLSHFIAERNSGWGRAVQSPGDTGRRRGWGSGWKLLCCFLGFLSRVSVPRSGGNGRHLPHSGLIVMKRTPFSPGSPIGCIQRVCCSLAFCMGVWAQQVVIPFLWSGLSSLGSDPGSRNLLSWFCLFWIGSAK